jgi:hypothetical protein
MSRIETIAKTIRYFNRSGSNFKPMQKHYGTFKQLMTYNIFILFKADKKLFEKKINSEKYCP